MWSVITKVFTIKKYKTFFQFDLLELCTFIKVNTKKYVWKIQFFSFLVDCYDICLIWFFFRSSISRHILVSWRIAVYFIQYFNIVNLVKYFLIFFFSFILFLFKPLTKKYAPFLSFTSIFNLTNPNKKKVVSVNAKSYVKELILPRA